MFSVLFEYAKKPANALLIIVVFLTLQNGLLYVINAEARSKLQLSHLLDTVNELIASILRKIIFHENFATLLNFLAHDLLMLLGDSTRQTILRWL